MDGQSLAFDSLLEPGDDDARDVEGVDGVDGEAEACQAGCVAPGAASHVQGARPGHEGEVVAVRDHPLRGLGAERLWALVAVLVVPPLAVISVTLAHRAESIGQAAAEAPFEANSRAEVLKTETHGEADLSHTYYERGQARISAITRSDSPVTEVDGTSIAAPPAALLPVD